MKTKPTNAFIVFAILLSFVLFSSSECAKELEEENCNPEKFWENTNQNLSSVSFSLDPPMLYYSISGPTDICTHEHIKVRAQLTIKEIPANSIDLVCIVDWSLFYEYPVHANNYEGPLVGYISPWESIGLSAYGNEKGWVNYRVEITWNPPTPYTTEAELKAYVNKYLLACQIQCKYGEYKP